ncbi:MAG: hypothetical protein A3K19_08460 [Lentisphaerae bacterium RIFOXYB12_FULL_65_16]|nr:MAG: hypothetical protein A3K18_03795 [Lentisphaerae bacterium RIFOXYA12_64_32]OGV89170.1 MAG: hypothetical protein A3K19_08460 [Lentisphaerae bacterium RIFOXYB12_FULL_65_16]
MKHILINTEGLETRVALVENGVLQEFFVERKGTSHMAGSVFKGRIRNLEPSLQAAFVDIGAERNAFLHYWDMLPASKDVLEGDDDSEEAEEQERSEAPAAAPEPTEPAKQRKAGLWDSLRQRFFPSPESERQVAGHEEPRPARRPPPRRRQQQRRPQVRVDDIPKLFKPDSQVLVQVTKGPIGSKGARVTTNLSIPGRYLVLLPNSSHVGVSKRVDDRDERDRLRQVLRQLPLPPGMGLICRTVGAGKDEKLFQRDLDMLLGIWSDIEKQNGTRTAPYCAYQEPDLVGRSVRDYLTEDIDEIVADSKEACDLAQQMVQTFSRNERVKVRFYNNPTPIFAKYSLTDQIESIFRHKVSLPGGGHICIDETEALIAIDVNSGRNRGGKDHPETIMRTNMEAVETIARQLRLRNLGGIIVLDLIDMRSRRDQHTVFKALKDALLADRARIKAYPISPLGLVEMTRQREYESLQQTMFSDCPYCHGKGLIKSATSMSVEIQRRLIELLRRRKGKLQARILVHPQVLERLKNEDAQLLTALERQFGGELSFREDPALHVEEFRLLDLATGDEL